MLNRHVQIDDELVEQMENLGVSIHPSMTYTLNDLLDAVYTMASRKAKNPQVAIYNNCGAVTLVNSNMKDLKVSVVENNQGASAEQADAEWEKLIKNLAYENY